MFPTTRTVAGHAGFAAWMAHARREHVADARSVSRIRTLARSNASPIPPVARPIRLPAILVVSIRAMPTRVRAAGASRARTVRPFARPMRRMPDGAPDRTSIALPGSNVSTAGYPTCCFASKSCRGANPERSRTIALFTLGGAADRCARCVKSNASTAA